MLTISELANLVGVTPRTIRHHHRLGVLPEPPRRSNGYRSYGPAHLIRLTRIRQMQQIGLGLAEIGRLLDRAGGDAGTGDGVEPADIRTALTALDDDLARQQREITRRRERIASLLAGPADVTLPAELAALLDEMVALGADPAHVAGERDALTLVATMYPEQVPALVRLYRAVLADNPDLGALSRRFSTLADADPADPAVEELADELVTALRRLHSGDRRGDGAAMPPILDAYLDEALSPAQRRCAELVGKAFA